MKQIMKKVLKPLRPWVLFPLKVYYKINLLNTKTNWASIVYDPNNKSFMSNLKRYVVNDIYYNELSDNEKLEFNKKYIWGLHAKSWHDYKISQYKEKNFFEKEFIFWRKPIVMAIRERERDYKQVIEVGCGHGLGLKYIKDILGDKKTYLGIDISKETIKETKERFKEDNKLNFEHKDIFELISSSDINGTIFVFFGTLEYFTENDILKLLNEIKNKSSSFMIAIHEPCNIDLENTKHSKPRGNIAYSHNYPYLFENSGIKIDYLDIRSIDNNTPHYNNIQLIGIGGER